MLWVFAAKKTLVDHGGFHPSNFVSLLLWKPRSLKKNDPNIMIGCWWSHPLGLRNMSPQEITHTKHHPWTCFYVHITKSAKNLGFTVISHGSIEPANYPAKKVAKGDKPISGANSLLVEGRVVDCCSLLPTPCADMCSPLNCKTISAIKLMNKWPFGITNPYKS